MRKFVKLCIVSGSIAMLAGMPLGAMAKPPEKDSEAVKACRVKCLPQKDATVYEGCMIKCNEEEKARRSKK